MGDDYLTPEMLDIWRKTLSEKAMSASPPLDKATMDKYWGDYGREKHLRALAERDRELEKRAEASKRERYAAFPNAGWVDETKDEALDPALVEKINAAMKPEERPDRTEDFERFLTRLESQQGGLDDIMTHSQNHAEGKHKSKVMGCINCLEDPEVPWPLSMTWIDKETMEQIRQNQYQFESEYRWARPWDKPIRMDHYKSPPVTFPKTESLIRDVPINPA